MNKKLIIISIVGGIIIGVSLGYIVGGILSFGEDSHFYIHCIPAGIIAGILVFSGISFINVTVKKMSLLIRCIIIFFAIVVGLVIWFAIYIGIWRVLWDL